MLESLIGYIIEVSRGLGVTLSVFAMTLIISLPLGVIVAVCRLSKNKIICSIAKFYIWVLRGTPLMLQIALVFFGLPSIGIVFEPSGRSPEICPKPPHPCSTQRYNSIPADSEPGSNPSRRWPSRPWSHRRHSIWRRSPRWPRPSRTRPG